MIAVRDSETLNILYPAGSNTFLCYKVTRGSTVLGGRYLTSGSPTSAKLNRKPGSGVALTVSDLTAGDEILARQPTAEGTA
jgi:hypothetical protein